MGSGVRTILVQLKYVRSPAFSFGTKQPQKLHRDRTPTEAGPNPQLKPKLL